MGSPMRTEDIQTLRREGCTLSYRVHGAPGTPLVALTHGVSLDHRTFEPQVPALVDAGYRVLTWDARGHGASRPLDAGISIAEVADDLVALLDAVGAEQAVLAGQSFGGMAVQDLLARQPTRVAALVVIGAPALGERPGPVMRILQRLRLPLARVWPDRHLRRTFANLITRDPDVRRYAFAASRQLPKPDFLAVSRAAMEGYLWAGESPTHGVPTLLVHGAAEEAPVVRSLQAWAEREERARLAAIPGAGHLVNQDAPDAFNAALLGFLNDLDLQAVARGGGGTAS